MLWKANEKSTQEENKSPNKRTDRDNWFGNICFTCGSIESGFYAMLIKNDDWAWCGSLRNPGKGNPIPVRYKSFPVGVIQRK